MKVLSIRQPWAWCIVHGAKDVENRTWGTKYRGPLLIHAGKIFDREAFNTMRSHGIQAPPADLVDKGGIVGVVDLIACVELAHSRIKSRWAFGPYCWILAYRRTLPFHPIRGQLGLFEVDYELQP